MSWIIVCSLLLVPQLQQPADAAATPGTVRLLDVTGDGLLDQLTLGPDGAVSVSVNVGSKTFLLVRQDLPTVKVTDVLVSDLDGDTLPDLYLVSPQDNVALLGDGNGSFRVATSVLGLIDGGLGKSAERTDVDGDRQLDLLLHNVGGDVLFWAHAPGRFVRDSAASSGTDPLTVLSETDAELLALLLASMLDEHRGANTTSGGVATAGGGTTTATPPSGPVGGQMPVDAAPPGGSSVLTVGPGAGGVTLGGRPLIAALTCKPLCPANGCSPSAGCVNVMDFIGKYPTTREAVQAAYDQAISIAQSKGSGHTVVFPPGETYAFSGVVIDSGFPITTVMRGAYLYIDDDTSPLFTIRGEKHSFIGGHIRQSVALLQATAFRVENTPARPHASQCKFIDIEMYSVYRGMDLYMDHVLGAAYRHSIQGCIIRNYTNQNEWPGSYGIRMGGSQVGNSAGNDSKIHDCVITGYETNIYTNGVATKLHMTSVDGGVGLEVDGGSSVSVESCYFEYNDTAVLFSNEPYDFRALNCTFANYTDLYLGSLAFGAEPQFLYSGSVLNQISNTVRVSTNTDDVLLLETNSGDYLKAGSDKCVIANTGFIGVGKDAPQYGLHLEGGQTVGASINQVNTSRPDNGWRLFPNYNTDEYILESAIGGPILRLNALGGVNISSLPTHDDDPAAGVAGLGSGDVYKTPTGEVRIKL
jgi:hypothetical protein